MSAGRADRRDRRASHAGASVLLSDGHDLTIGSGEGADLVLVDERVEPHHATIRLAGDVLTLTALHDGVSVFGYPLRPGKPAMLGYGSWFTAGAATLQFSGRDALTPATVLAAELSWLLRHAPLAYLARRWATLPRHLKLLVAFAPGGRRSLDADGQLLAPYLMPRDNASRREVRRSGWCASISTRRLACPYTRAMCRRTRI